MTKEQLEALLDWMQYMEGVVQSLGYVGDYDRDRLWEKRMKLENTVGT